MTVLTIVADGLLTTLSLLLCSRLYFLDVLDTHPEFQHLLSSGALFHDPHSRQPIKSGKNAVVTRIWSAAPGTTDRGAWVDLTSRAGAAWWRKGVQGLIELGVDGIWK